MILFTDGGARGNPGPSAIGVVLKDLENATVTELGRYIGSATNNEAEYTALIEGLKLAISKNVLELECRLDSELVVKQMNGLYKVKNERLEKMYKEAKGLCQKFSNVTFVHIPRTKNKEADALVNKVLDATTSCK